MERGRIASLPSNGNVIRKLKNQAFFSIDLEWLKAFPRDWIFLKSHAKLEKTSPERSTSRAICTRTWHVQLRSSVILATDAHCKCNSLRPKFSTCPCKKPRLRLHTPQDYKRDGFRILSKSFWSPLEAIFFFAFPAGPHHWSDRFDLVLCLRLGTPFELKPLMFLSCCFILFLSTFNLSQRRIWWKSTCLW